MKTIFYDVDTQNDFMNKDGALYVPNAELIKPNLAKLTKYACQKGIPIFGSVDRHFGTAEYKEHERELQRNGGPFPDHCMDGSDGQNKIMKTIRYNNNKKRYSTCVALTFIENPLNDKKPVIWVDNKEVELEENKLQKLIKAYIKQTIQHYTDTRENNELYLTPGIFFEKQHYDVATNPWFEKVMQAIAPEKAIVYGVATDYCVKAGAIALKRFGAKEVYVVTDAIKGITKKSTESALEEMANKGIKFATTKEITKL